MEGAAGDDVTPEGSEGGFEDMVGSGRSGTGSRRSRARRAPGEMRPLKICGGFQFPVSYSIGECRWSLRREAVRCLLDHESD